MYNNINTHNREVENSQDPNNQRQVDDGDHQKEEDDGIQTSLPPAVYPHRLRRVGRVLRDVTITGVATLTHCIHTAFFIWNCLFLRQANSVKPKE